MQGFCYSDGSNGNRRFPVDCKKEKKSIDNSNANAEAKRNKKENLSSSECSGS